MYSLRFAVNVIEKYDMRMWIKCLARELLRCKCVMLMESVSDLVWILYHIFAKTVFECIYEYLITLPPYIECLFEANNLRGPMYE